MPMVGKAQVGLVTLYGSVLTYCMRSVRVSFSGIVRVSVRRDYNQANAIVNLSREFSLECHLHG